MKKVLIVLAVLLMASPSVMAQPVSDLLLGFNVGYGHMILTESNNDITRTQPMLSLGGFIDATFIRLGVDYTRTMGDTDYEMGDYSVSGDSYETTNLNFSILGKLPIDFGSIKLWVGGGVLYSWNLTEEVNGSDVSDNSDLNDFYLIAAFGADISLSDALFLCPAITAGYNLTPNPTDPEASGDWKGYLWTASIGVGFRM